MALVSSRGLLRDCETSWRFVDSSTVYSLSPDLDLEFKTFSIFPRQTQIAAPGGGTWPAGPATSRQPRSSSVFRIQVQVSRSWSLLALCLITGSALGRSRFYCVKTRRPGHSGHTALVGPLPAPALAAALFLHRSQFLNGRSFEWFEHLFWVNIFLSFLSIQWRFPCLGAQRLNSCTINCSCSVILLCCGSDCLDRRYSYILIHFTPLHS